MKGKLITVIVGVCIAAASWAPLWIVEAYDRYAMPVGLGLVAIAGSLVGGVIAVIGVVGLVIRNLRSPGRNLGHRGFHRVCPSGLSLHSH